MNDQRLRINWGDIHPWAGERRGHLHVFARILLFNSIPPRVPEVRPHTLLELVLAPIITFDKRGHLNCKLRIVRVASCPKNVVKQHLRKAPRLLHVDLQPRPTGGYLPNLLLKDAQVCYQSGAINFYCIRVCSRGRSWVGSGVENVVWGWHRLEWAMITHTLLGVRLPLRRQVALKL